jgi:hypothetical protein
MAVIKNRLLQSLRKRIKVSDAKPCSLRVQLALPAGEADLENHIVSELVSGELWRSCPPCSASESLCAKVRGCAGFDCYELSDSSPAA